MGLGSAGVFLLSTVIFDPVVAMKGVALGSSLLSIVGEYINTRLTLKAQKHERIKSVKRNLSLLQGDAL